MALWFSLKNPVFWLGFFLISACQHQPIPPNWHANTIETTHFRLQSVVPDELSSVDVLTVMIEGDGLAWISRSRPSSDPTPRQAVALSVAAVLPNAVYLARPCQYVWSDICAQTFWTDGRFHPWVIESMEQAVLSLKEKYGAKKIILMGYSGGGVVAGLLASRLPPEIVQEWVTVASPISWEPWIAHHHVSPLSHSLSLEPEVSRLVHVPQKHYLGAKDTIVPWEVQDRWRAEMSHNPKAAWYRIPGLAHGGNWAKVFAIAQ